ncbi:MAG: hypothetical protein KKD01_02930 [Proteobacteria bacterium]|nr:hypothetical protein [Pseudomonadota bacterium]MBU1453656.1 hypothetical protein [Pseudomonadota bacterium]
MMKKCARVLAVTGLIVAGTSLSVNAAGDDMQTQIDGIMGALPKFAVPMREVGDRFQNMYFAAEGGNWALASYMSKYMDKAMNPAKVTKPKEYPDWRSFYDGDFAAVNKAIAAEDLGTFKKEYSAVIASCNDCHAGMGYGFIEVKKLAAPADQGIEYKLSSKAADVPK